MPTEPIRFDSNGEVIQPQVAEIPSHSTTTAWADLARNMGWASFATDMGTHADPGPAISDMAYIGGDWHVRFVGSRRWEPVRRMSRTEAGLPSYTPGDNYATPWDHPDHPLRTTAAYDRDHLRRAELAAELAARPTQPPSPAHMTTAEILAAADRIRAVGMPTTTITQTLPYNLPDLPPPTGDYLPPQSLRRGRTAAERAADAAAAERRRISDPPHDGPPMAEAAGSTFDPTSDMNVQPPQTWADIVTPTEPLF